MKTFKVAVDIEVEDDDTRGVAEIEQVIRQALYDMPEEPYIDFTDLSIEEEYPVVLGEFPPAFYVTNPCL